MKVTKNVTLNLNIDCMGDPNLDKPEPNKFQNVGKVKSLRESKAA